jgi:hypothetical protein
MPPQRRWCRPAVGLVACAVALGVLAPAQATTPLGTQARVSFTGADGDPILHAFSPGVAYNPATNQYLVVWSADTVGGDEIFARLVDAGGAPVGAEIRISDMGAPAAAGFDAGVPDVAYNTLRNEYLVVWSGDDSAGPLVNDEFEIFAQGLDATGAEVGANDRRISDMGPDGDTGYSAFHPDIAYNANSNQYLVAWSGDDDTGPLVVSEKEIFVQRLDTTGAEVGANDRRISDMGPDGNTGFDTAEPAIAHDPTSDQYMVAWQGEDDTGSLVENEFEIFAQRLSASGAEVGANDRRISDMGPNGDTIANADSASIAFNPTTNEYLVAWEGDDIGGPFMNETEIYIQRLDAAGTQVGANDQRISHMGPDGDAAFRANFPSVAVGPGGSEYLVTWDATDDGPALNGGFEVYAQRLAPDGAEIGGDDMRVSVMGAEGDPLSDGLQSSVAFNPTSNEYLIAWEGDTGIAPLVNNKSEVYARRFGAGTPAGGGTVPGGGPLPAGGILQGGAVCRVLPAPPAATPGDPSDITLTTGQLLINQRIDQAAIRRANGVQVWLDDRIEGRDLCQGTLGAGELAPGIVTDAAGGPITFGVPDPRPIVVAAAKTGDASQFTLTVGQLLINQRISQAAIRRLNGLKARMDDGLTGGDVEDLTLAQPVLAAGLRVRVAPPPASPPAASVTVIAAAAPGDPSKVTLSTGQLLINQRISQAAVRRANELIARIEDGLVATDVKDGSVTALDLTPGVVVP